MKKKSFYLSIWCQRQGMDYEHGTKHTKLANKLNNLDNDPTEIVRVRERG